METIEKKVNVEKLREDIRKLAKKQIFLKNQRKTNNIVGERKMPAWEATMHHHHNRRELSIKYAALLVLRGKSEDEAAEMHLSKKRTEWEFSYMKNKIQKILESYTEKGE